MKNFKMNNGLRIVWEPRNSDTVAIEISIGVGSNRETTQIAGMSHFLEHMMFEGTSSRSAKKISETIENIGGDINAATCNWRTFYYVKIPKKHFSTGLDILSDMMQNSVFDKDSLEKERQVVLEEIKMVNDQPLMYQWVLFESCLFKKHPAKNPIYGRVDSVKSITKHSMENFYNKWYCPCNMVVSVVGGPKNTVDLVKKSFGKMKKRTVPKIVSVHEPKDIKPTEKVVKKDTNQAYLVLGFKTVSRSHKDSIALDVAAAIFSKGLSGRISEEIRIKRGLAYSVGAGNDCEDDYGFFAFHLNCARKNLALCIKLILKNIKELDNLKDDELNDAKQHIIGKILVMKENSSRRADDLALWTHISNAKLSEKYLAQIASVTVKDVLNVRNKYLSKNHTATIIKK
ncbi:insulinase family protein [Candidatus Woesearchaeota archaeon]|nr:insulinase family protein [Candidatus Woesearchaeota archaeon]